MYVSRSLTRRGFALATSANVETILEIAHPTLIEALGSGALKINGAMQLCKAPHAEQLMEFIRYSEERAILALFLLIAYDL